MRAAIALAALVLASGGASVSRAQEAAAVATTEAIDAQFDALVAEAALPLAGVLVFDAQGQIYQRLTPTLTRTQAVPIASASKWVAAALIMTAVDRGELTLADPVGKWIPEAPPSLHPATLRQLLSHTSGMAAGDLSSMGPVNSLEDSVLKLVARPMARAPGAGFAYGGASMQVAGLMLERAAKRSYATLFAERLARPLGMRTAAVGSPPSWGTAKVPWVAGGMAMSLDDYQRFLQMMLRNGEFGGKRILSAASIAAIETDMVRPIPVASRTGVILDASYGLGVWCGRISPEGRCGLVSSAGAFGTYPWIDRQSGRAGIFLTRAQLRRVTRGAYALRDATNALPRATQRAQ